MDLLNLTTLAGFITLLVAVLTAMKLLTDNFERLLQIWERWRTYRKKGSYILLPSVEEIARYSIKEPESKNPDKHEITEDINYKLKTITNERVNHRIFLISLIITIIFLSISARLIHIGLTGE